MAFLLPRIPMFAFPLLPGRVYHRCHLAASFGGLRAALAAARAVYCDNVALTRRGLIRKIATRQGSLQGRRAPRGDNMKKWMGCVTGALFTLTPFVASASIPIAHCRPGDRTESG